MSTIPTEAPIALRGRTKLDEIGVARGLIQVPFDVHSVSGRLWDRHSRVNSEQAGNHAEPDDDAPHVVDRSVIWVVEDRVFECSSDNESDNGSYKLSRKVRHLVIIVVRNPVRLTRYVAKALHCKDGDHHASTEACCSELGGDDS